MTDDKSTASTQALQTTTPQPVAAYESPTYGIHTKDPVSARSIYHLVLNCVVPGLGSYLHQRYAQGLLLSGAVVGGITLIFLSFYIWGLGLIGLSYLFSIIFGVKFLNESEEI